MNEKLKLNIEALEPPRTPPRTFKALKYPIHLKITEVGFFDD